MSKAANTRFTFKEELTSIDYQKIMIEQNQTIIQLLMMQQNDLIHGALNTAVITMYNNAIKPYIIVPEKSIPEEKKGIIDNLKRRQEEGEDIRKLSIDLGVSDYFEFD